MDEWFEKTVDALIAAGYYRARLTAISPFDRILGGLVWCLTTIDTVFDISGDNELILFEEDANIGVKMFVPLFRMNENGN